MLRQTSLQAVGIRDTNDFLICPFCKSHARFYGNTETLSTCIASPALYAEQCDAFDTALGILSCYNADEKVLSNFISILFNEPFVQNIYQLDSKHIARLLFSLRNLTSREEHAFKTIRSYTDYIRYILHVKMIQLPKGYDFFEQYYSTKEAKKDFLHKVYQIESIEELEQIQISFNQEEKPDYVQTSN